ncbi:MAG: futalosine hydrolase [Chloroflexota bacterium]
MSQLDLLLLCATEGEAREIAAAIVDPETTGHAGKTTVRGQLGRERCRLAYTGIGPVNAAHALTCQLERHRPYLVIQVGIAGAYVPAGLPVGSVALASEEIYGDLGVLTPEGWQPADLIGIPVVAGDPPRFNRFALDPGLVGRATRVLAAGAEDRPVRSGPFLTLSQVTGVRSVGDTLFQRFGALCESMEGAAAAHVCALYDVPFLEVRGVSNLVEDRDRSPWQITAAAQAVQHAVLRLIAHLDEVMDAKARGTRN